MPQENRTILVTSALPYANGSIHLGHLVEYIQTDIWVRYQKLRGHDCLYVCADDAHGTPIMLRAAQEGITPEQLIEAVGREHRADFDDFHIGFDNYHSTHSPENRELAELVYRRHHDAQQPFVPNQSQPSCRPRIVVTSGTAFNATRGPASLSRGR